MGIPEIELKIKRLLSSIDKSAYPDTIEQLECLIPLWKKIHTRIHTSHSIERSQFVHSFNTIKAVTTRNEFLDIYEAQYSADIFDSFDNLFSRLTQTEPDKSGEWSSLFLGIEEKTEMFENMMTTHVKLNALTGLATESPNVAKFYIICFMLLLAMEGIYDEVVRFLYATEQIIDGKTTINPDALKHTRIEKIKANIRTTPSAIFDVWDRGHRVRNAIAHARFYYGEKDNKMRFVDVNPRDPAEVYTISLTVKEVRDLVNKIIVISGAFRHLFVLLQIYSLLIIPPENIRFF